MGISGLYPECSGILGKLCPSDVVIRGPSSSGANARHLKVGTPKAKLATETSARCQGSKRVATIVSVQLPREEIRPGRQAWLETSTAESPCLGPGEGLATVGVSQRALVQVGYHKHVLLCVPERPHFAEYPLCARLRLGHFMNF